MNIDIQAPFSILDADKVKINESIEHLGRYNVKITQVNVYFKTGDGNQVKAVVAEIEVHLPGKPIFVSDSAEQYMDAFKGVTEKLDRQLRKEKDLRKSHK